LELRQLADVVVTDGETARLEAYRIPLSADLAVITRSGFVPAAGRSSKKYLELRMAPVEAIQHLLERGYSHILLEVGPNILSELVAAGLVDELCLTNTEHSKPALSAIGIASAELVYDEQQQDTSFGVWREIQAL
jgi:riboflavin biosynthesis pyrimidine reductase